MPDIRPRQVLNHDLILVAIADDKDDKALPLQIEGQRSRQGKRRRAGDDNHLQTSTTASPLGTARFPVVSAGAISTVDDGAGRDDEEAG